MTKNPSPAEPVDRLLSAGIPFTAGQAYEVGLSRDVLRRLTDEGVLRRIVKGAYVDSMIPDSVSIRAMALALVVPPSAVITDRTAGWLHGAQVLAPGDHLALPPISVFQTPGHIRIRTAVNRGGVRQLAPADIETIGGIRLTTALRTALDLGRLLRRYEAIAALDALLRLRQFSQRDLLRELPRFKGFRGVRQLRELGLLADIRAESPPESVLRLHWLDAGLPPPQPQLPVSDGSFERYRLDLGLEAARYAAEYDGAEYHDAGQLAHDQRRRRWLRERGWTIDVFRQVDLFGPDCNPGAVLRRGYRRAQQRRLESVA